jgi:hypothetical protein
VEAKVMRKQLVIVGITLVLLAVGISGCTNNNNGSLNTNKNTGTNGNTGTNNTGTNESTGNFNEKILGQWLATAKGGSTAQFSFYANGSFYFKDLTSYYDNSSHDVSGLDYYGTGEYTMIGNTLTIDGEAYVCVFSDNDNKMTTYSNGQVDTVYTRQ